MRLRDYRFTLMPALALSLLVWAPPVQACSWPNGLFERETQNTRRVEGTLDLNTEAQSINLPLGEAPTPMFKAFQGTITDRRGRKYEVTYKIGLGPFACSPFTQPETNTSGTFFLKKLGSQKYELIHWIGNQ